MHRQSFQIPVWVIAFSLFFCVGPIGLWGRWELNRGFVGRGCCSMVFVGLALLDFPELLDVAGKVFVAIDDHLLWEMWS